MDILSDSMVVPPLMLLGCLAGAAIACPMARKELNEQGVAEARRLQSQWGSMWAGPVAELERYLRRKGFAHLLTADELRMLPLVLAGCTGMTLAMDAERGGQQQRKRQPAGQAAEAFRELVALHPSLPAFKLHYGLCLLRGPPAQGAASVAALRDAFCQADASTGGQHLCCVCV